jgi:hypothetical protein
MKMGNIASLWRYDVAACAGNYSRNNPWIAAAVQTLLSAPTSSRARRILTRTCATRCTG